MARVWTRFSSASTAATRRPSARTASRWWRARALVPAPGRHPTLWRPAWLIEADITVGERLRSGGRSSEGWSARRTFIVPAFVTPLDDLTRLARALSEAAGTTAEIPREPIHGGTLAIEDAVTLIRHIVIGDEVRKSDMLASLQVDIEVVANRLVALPFEKTGDGLRCAITGVTGEGGRLEIRFRISDFGISRPACCPCCGRRIFDISSLACTTASNARDAPQVGLGAQRLQSTPAPPAGSPCHGASSPSWRNL